jgi:hypothetical protein
MDSYGDGNTYRDVVCNDSKVRAFKWRTDMHEEAIDEYVKNLRCCGNCGYYLTPDCPMHEEIPDSASVYSDPNSCEVCDNWTFDRRTAKDRMTLKEN